MPDRDSEPSPLDILEGEMKIPSAEAGETAELLEGLEQVEVLVDALEEDATSKVTCTYESPYLGPSGLRYMVDFHFGMDDEQIETLRSYGYAGFNWDTPAEAAEITVLDPDDRKMMKILQVNPGEKSIPMVSVAPGFDVETLPFASIKEHGLALDMMIEAMRRINPGDTALGKAEFAILALHSSQTVINNSPGTLRRRIRRGPLKVSGSGIAYSGYELLDFVDGAEALEADSTLVVHHDMDHPEIPHAEFVYRWHEDRHTSLRSFFLDENRRHQLMTPAGERVMPDEVEWMLEVLDPFLRAVENGSLPKPETPRT